MKTLSWAHHSLVASLPPREQKALLRQAVKMNLSVADFRKLVREHKAKDIVDPPTPIAIRIAILDMQAPEPVAGTETRTTQTHEGRRQTSESGRPDAKGDRAEVGRGEANCLRLAKY